MADSKPRISMIDPATATGELLPACTQQAASALALHRRRDFRNWHKCGNPK